MIATDGGGKGTWKGFGGFSLLVAAVLATERPMETSTTLRRDQTDRAARVGWTGLAVAGSVLSAKQWRM
jgi:hypothetical protein